VPPDKYFPEWILHATPEGPAREAEFVAAMQIRRLGPEADPEATIEPLEADGAHALRLGCGDRTHQIMFRKAAASGPLQCGGLETDGQAAAVELDAAGKVTRAMAAGATFLRYDGQDLFRSDQPQDWATGSASKRRPVAEGSPSE
jgi:hypothetical protein